MELIARLFERDEVFPRHFRLHQVGGTDDDPALGAADAQVLFHHRLDLGRGAERQGGLGANGAPERQAVAKLGMHFGKVHALRLHRIEDVDADFDQFFYERQDIAAGMVEDEHVRVDRAAGGDHLGQARLEPDAPQGGVHHRGGLHADVIPELNDVAPALGKGANQLAGNVGDLVEQDGGAGAVVHHVGHQIFHAAQIPGGFPNCAGHAAHGGEAAGLDAAHFAGHVRHRRVGQDRVRVVFDFGQGGIARQRVMHAGHVIAVGLPGMADAKGVKTDVGGQAFPRVELRGRRVGGGQRQPHAAARRSEPARNIVMAEPLFERFHLGGAESVGIQGNRLKALAAEGAEQVFAGGHGSLCLFSFSEPLAKLRVAWNSEARI